MMIPSGQMRDLADRLEARKIDPKFQSQSDSAGRGYRIGLDHAIMLIRQLADDFDGEGQ